MQLVHAHCMCAGLLNATQEGQQQGCSKQVHVIMRQGRGTRLIISSSGSQRSDMRAEQIVVRLRCKVQA